MAIPTVRRINDWAVPVRFWNKTLQQSPQSPIPHLALTATEIEARNYPAAEQHLENAFAVGMKRDADNQFAREMMRMLKRPTGVGPR
jgi:Tfp pilus assembly protein PilF